MRCHAKFKEFRCELDMSDHLPDRHIFTIEWDDEGEVIGEFPQRAFPPTVVPTAGDTTDVGGDTVSATPAPAEPPGDGTGYYLDPATGGIRFTPAPSDTCFICGHTWHTAECPQMIHANGNQIACGCETSA